MDCPYYEEHGGEYYQGMWEFEDCCYFSQVLDYKCNCSSNPECWYKRQDGKREILEIIDQYFAPSKEYDVMNDRWLTYESKCGPAKDNLVEHIKTIVKTLEELK